MQRYRAGTARRVGRSWLASLNVAVIGFSTWLFLVTAAATNVWVPGALRSAVAGLAGGIVLGWLGLRLTRWEPHARGLHYTPNRLLVLLITVIVAARVCYGFTRAWQAWHNPNFEGSWVAAAGASGSLAVGGVVLAYYLTCWAGVRRRVKARGKLNVISVR